MNEKEDGLPNITECIATIAKERRFIEESVDLLSRLVKDDARENFRLFNWPSRGDHLNVVLWAIKSRLESMETAIFWAEDCVRARAEQPGQAARESKENEKRR